MDDCHKCLCLVFGAPSKSQRLLTDPLFKSPANPSTQLQKMFLDLAADLLRKARQLGSQQRGNAKWFVPSPNAAFPVLDVCLKPRQRIVDLLGQRHGSLQKVLSMSPEDRNDQVRLRRKVMMNTGLADLDSLGNIRVAERRVSPVRDKRLGRLEDAICGFTLHDYETTN